MTAEQMADDLLARGERLLEALGAAGEATGETDVTVVATAMMALLGATLRQLVQTLPEPIGRSIRVNFSRLDAAVDAAVLSVLLNAEKRDDA